MPVVVALLVVGIALVAYGLDGLLRARRTQAVDLAIARRIVERHGGRIWADSVVGRGTTISFVLPPLAQ